MPSMTWTRRCLLNSNTYVCCCMYASVACARPSQPPQFSYVLSAEIADDAQRDLDEALPALDAAVASLKNLSRNDVVEVKALQNPPQGEREGGEGGKGRGMVGWKGVARCRREGPGACREGGARGMEGRGGGQGAAEPTSG